MLYQLCSPEIAILMSVFCTHVHVHTYTMCIYVQYICLCLPAADECLPEEKRALLKWKMSSITPNVVRSCLTRVGFAKLKSERKES